MDDRFEDGRDLAERQLLGHILSIEQRTDIRYFIERAVPKERREGPTERRKKED